MEKQVGQLCKSAWHYLYKINKIRQYLTTDQVETIVHAFVTTKLDLNNSLLSGLPGYIIHRLQLVQNAAAKTVADLKKFDHVTHVLQNLNWLPVEKRIMFVTKPYGLCCGAPALRELTLIVCCIWKLLLTGT